MFHRVHYIAVAGAAAQNAAQRIQYLVVGRRFVVFEQVCRRHQHTRRAYPALRCAIFVECLLKFGQPAVFTGKAFDGGDIASRNLRHRDKTGTDLFAIQEHRARPAIPCVAAYLGTSISEVFAQHMGEPTDRLGIGNRRFSIEIE